MSNLFSVGNLLDMELLSGFNPEIPSFPMGGTCVLCKNLLALLPRYLQGVLVLEVFLTGRYCGSV
jgi:hypothetical protein